MPTRLDSRDLLPPDQVPTSSSRPRCRGCGRDLQRANPETLTDLCYWCAQRAVAAERLAFLKRVRHGMPRRA